MKYLIFIIIVLLSNIIHGITGFAGTVLAMPFSIMLLGISTAKPVLNILTIAACVAIVAKNHHHIVWKEFFIMTSIMLVGVFVGEYLYEVFPVSILLEIYAIFIILIALKGIFIKKDFSLPQWLLLIIVLLAGVIHGMFISGGPLLIIYAVKKLKTKESFRSTLSPVWIVLNSYILLKQAISGVITPDVMRLTAISLPALFIGVAIGGILAKKLSQKTFLALTYILLLISGISLII